MVPASASRTRRKLNPDMFADFRSDILLAQLSLGKFLLYTVRSFYNLGYTHMVCNQKK